MLQRVLFLAFLCAVVPRPTQAQSYTFTTLDYPGATSTSPNAVNSTGVIVGSYVDTASTTHGFAYFYGKFVTVDVPNAKFTALTGINKNGVLCGNFANTATHGFVWEKGRLTQVDFPGAPFTNVNGITDTGALGGSYVDAQQTLHGFVRHGKNSYTTMDFPGTSETSVNSVNSHGDFTGQTSPPFISAFLFSNNQWLDFYYPNAFTTTGDGINDLGQIVGVWNPQDPTLPQQGFLRNPDGTFQAINFPGSSGSAVLGINDLGVLVGSYSDSAGASHGFIAKPSD
jgi:uncharacterized membrane protein